MAHELAQQDTRKLKILISLLYYVPHRTGLTIHVQQVAEELVRRGHDVTVITARFNRSLPRDEEMHNGVRVIRLWAPIHISRGMIMPAYPLAMLLAMREADVVSVHTPMMETAFVAILAKLAGVHVIPTHHGDLVLPARFLNRMIQSIMLQLFKVLAASAPQLIAYSQDYAQNSYYLRPYLDKTSTIYPPVRIPEPNREHARHLREQWQHGGGPVIGYSGRFVQEKRPDLAIRALEVINQHYPNARIVFAGEYDIPYENTWEVQRELISRHREQLIFLGLLKDPQELADFYAACDVIVLPSDTECFALVQVEAMLCGTPMVMTDIPGGRVPVTVTGMGRLAKQGDAVSIGEALVEVIRNREQYVRPRSEIARHFSFQETVDRYEAIFRRYARSRKDG
jgi:glycosyltransferase involved in cell wall biosynthesis